MIEVPLYLGLILVRALLSSRSYSERGRWAVVGLKFQKLGIRLGGSLDRVVVCEEMVSSCN